MNLIPVASLSENSQSLYPVLKFLFFFFAGTKKLCFWKMKTLLSTQVE